MSKKRINYQKVIQLNAIGMSLREIGEEIGCHYTTVRHILNSFGVPVFDTRHSFTFNLFSSLSTKHKEMLLNKIPVDGNLNDYLHSLIIKDLLKDSEAKD